MMLAACFRRFLAVLAGVVLLVAPCPASAQLAVIVNQQSGIEHLNKSDVINIFMGNHRELPGGIQAKPVDMPVGTLEKAMFYRLLVNRDLDQMAAYWSRLIFAGSTAPPQQTSRTADVVQFVANNRGAIGYVDRNAVDSSRVKVVFVLQ